MLQCVKQLLFVCVCVGGGAVCCQLFVRSVPDT